MYAKKARIETGSEMYDQSSFYGVDYTCNKNEEYGNVFSDTNSKLVRDTKALSNRTSEDQPQLNDSASARNEMVAVPSASDHGQPFLEGQTNNEYTSFSELLRELGQESKMVMLQYSQTFGDSEAYEQQACQNFVDLKAHATLLEQTIDEKKMMLHVRLKDILKVLTINSNDNI